MILKHSKPEEIKGEYAKQLDFPTWLAYGITLMSLTACMLLIRMVHGLSKYADISDIILRLIAGVTEPHSLAWFKNVSSSNIIANMWSILALSFFTFYLIEFRSFIIGQKFPNEISDVSEIDFLESGFIYDKNIFHFRSRIFNPKFELGNYGIMQTLVANAHGHYIGEVSVKWKSRNILCPELELIPIEVDFDFKSKKKYNVNNLKQLFCPYYEKTAAAITSR